MKISWKSLSPVAAVFAALAVSVAVKTPAFETSLEAIAGKDSISLPEPVRRAASSRVQAVASSRSFDDALALAEKFVSTLDGELRRSVRFRVDGDGLGKVLDFYRNGGGGFVTKRDRSLLETGGDALFDEVLGRIASPVPSLFGFSDDPYRFLDGFVKNLPRGFGQWKTRGDVLAAEKDGIWNVLVSFAVPEAASLDIKTLPAVLGKVVGDAERLNAESSTASLSLSGVPVHTFETSGKCERQIAVLSAFSLVFIFVLALVTLKSLTAIALIALNLALAAATGFAALNLTFASVHMLSLVFGTTLIGIAVDYSFHRILTSSRDALPKVRANLVKSCLTTLVSLVPLAFSGIGVLVQSAVFLAAGLVTSLLYNLFVLDMFGFRLPDGTRPPPREDREAAEQGRGRILPAVLMLVLLPLSATVDFRTEAQDLHSPSEKLKTAERMISELSGIGAESGMLVVEGDGLEDVLEKESRLGLEQLSLSKFVPPFARREENCRMAGAFHGKYARRLAERLGVDGSFPAPAPVRRLEAAELPQAIAGQFLFDGGGGRVMTLVPQVSPAEAAVAAARTDGVRFYAPRAMLLKTIGECERRILKLLFVSFALLALMLWGCYRARAFLIVLPSVTAVSTMFAAVSFFCGHVNLFHLLSAFMIVGMALDYTIFLAGDFRGGFKAVVCSLLTSMAGFGALAFVSFPIIRSVGAAMGIGLPLSFVSAWLIFRPRPNRQERAATPAGLEMTWIVYRVFGKRALDLVARAVANAVWMFDGKARRSAGSRRKLVNFALSLGDKIAVLSMGRGQPEIRLDESGDGPAFIGDVAAKKGVVVVSSHLGTIETLAAYGECAARFHVFMALSLTGVFRAFKERHACRPMIEVHPTEGFSMAELFLGSDIVERGDVVLIAGDRGGGRSREMPFLGGTRRFPEGAFRFAKHLGCPVYFVASVRERGGYRVYAKRLSPQDAMGDYVRELERLVKIYPDQWYQWNGEGSENG